MFACFGFANAQLRMLATFPVDRQNDFTLLFIDISDDIGHERAEELLTTTHVDVRRAPSGLQVSGNARSEEHTSELQSLMRSSYAVFCLQKKKKINSQYQNRKKNEHIEVAIRKHNSKK